MIPTTNLHCQRTPGCVSSLGCLKTTQRKGLYWQTAVTVASTADKAPQAPPGEAWLQAEHSLYSKEEVLCCFAKWRKKDKLN
jgi:hypothetical protein